MSLVDVAIPKSLLPEATFPSGTVLPALLIAILSESLKLHDIVSNVFRIRAEFDVRYILLPMAVMCGVQLTDAKLQQLIQHRAALMGQVFYAFASSSPGKSTIDEHDIKMAMTQWSHYWCLLEANVWVLATAALLIIYTQFKVATVMLSVFVAATGLMAVTMAGCRRYVRGEIRQILADSARMRTITQALNAL
jgi:hypothetical protein